MEALEALNLILIEKLRGNGEWGQRGYPLETVLGAVDYPYATWFWSGGGNERQAVGVHTARLQMSVKGVCGEQDGITDPHGTAMKMQGQLSALLLNSGIQDAGANSLPANANWDVLTVTQGRVIFTPVQLDDKSWSFHAGHVWEFLMEES